MTNQEKTTGEKKNTVEINGRPYYTRAGAAKMLLASASTIDRLALRKKIEYFRHPYLGKLFLPENIEGFIARETVRAKR